MTKKPYKVTIESATVDYGVIVYAVSPRNAAFAAGREVTNYPALYPRPRGEEWTVTEVVRIKD